MDDELSNDKNRNRDVKDEIEDGAGGPVANAILGANVGGGIEGSLAGAVLGEAAAEDLVKMPVEEELPPINVDKLDDFRSPDAQKGSSEANG